MQRAWDNPARIRPRTLTPVRLARAILAFVAAWSIAAAPVVAGYAPAWAGVPVGHGIEHQAAPHADARHQAMMQDQSELGASVPCLHDEQAPAQKSPDGCGSMAGCALCYATALPALHLTLAGPVGVAATLSWHLSEPVAAAASAGPFRPPRA